MSRVWAGHRQPTGRVNVDKNGEGWLKTLIKRKIKISKKKEKNNKPKGVVFEKIKKKKAKGREWAGHGQGMGKAWAGHGQGMSRTWGRANGENYIIL